LFLHSNENKIDHLPVKTYNQSMKKKIVIVKKVLTKII